VRRRRGGGKGYSEENFKGFRVEIAVDFDVADTFLIGEITSVQKYIDGRRVIDKNVYLRDTRVFK
jgi:hypothetical protein